MLDFSCHLGHTFSPESILEAQSGELERSLYVAVRMLRERADLLTRLAAQTSWGQPSTQFASRAREHRDHADVIQAFLEKGEQRGGWFFDRRWPSSSGARRPRRE